MSPEIVVPYTITNGRIPVVVHVPHASTVFPKRMLEDGTVLNRDVDLRESVETIADRYVEVLVKRAFDKSGLKPYFFESTISRMFMDPERFDGEDEIMNDVGMGVVYTKNHKGQDIYSVPPTDDQIAHRIQRLYKPYSSAFMDTVDHILHKHGRCLIVDAHSYASEALDYELYSDEPRTPLVLGYDSFHVQEIMSPLSALRAKAYTSSNSVFKGSYVPLKHLNTNSAVSSVMFEVRKDVYMDESAGCLEKASNGSLLSAINEDMLDLVIGYLSNSVS